MLFMFDSFHSRFTLLDCTDHKLNLPFAHGRFELHSLLLCFVVAMASDRSYHLLARIYHSRSRGQAALVSAISDFVLQIPCKFQDMTCSNLLQACCTFANLFS